MTLEEVLEMAIQYVAITAGVERSVIWARKKAQLCRAGPNLIYNSMYWNIIKTS